MIKESRHHFDEIVFRFDALVLEGRRSQFADRNFDIFDRSCIGDRRSQSLIINNKNKGRLRSDTLNVAEESREAVVAEV
ncbi:hypothetical protein L596_000782 [Steinernema carpocapsae]|uniref:Uncharacterized protein n=1 Tax=Steinernema carpocapsae TaxID=34508 RepID=A0A4U8UNC1_STECR|nr:hypothetical protein L596_000782 [Steinernema carpocapsae]